MAHHEEPIDPDVTPAEVVDHPVGVALRERRDVLAVVAAGGALGSLARWAVAESFPHPSSGFPWSVLGVNVLGCLLLGMLMVGVLTRWPDHRHLRPFLGVGVLGGFTTFSTYVVDTRTLLAADRAGLATAYLVGTLVAGLAATVLGLRLGRLFWPGPGA